MAARRSWILKATSGRAHDKVLERLTVPCAVVVVIVRERHDDLHRGEVKRGGKDDVPLAHEHLEHGGWLRLEVPPSSR